MAAYDTAQIFRKLAILQLTEIAFSLFCHHNSIINIHIHMTSWRDTYFQKIDIQEEACLVEKCINL